MAYFYLGEATNSTKFVLEICHGITEKIVMWQKTTNGWEKNMSI